MTAVRVLLYPTTITRPLTLVYTRDGGRTCTCLSASSLRFVLTGSQPLSKESALHGRFCFCKLPSRTLLSAQLSWCFAVGGGKAWALCYWTRLLPGGQGRLGSPTPNAGAGCRVTCSSLKPCASLEGVGTCPFPSDPVLEQKTGGSLELYRLETQRVFPLLPEQRQYGLILESRKVSSKLSESKGGEAHSLKLGFSWGSTGRPRQSPRAFLVGGSPVASLPTRDRTLAPRPRVGRAES